MGFLKSILVFLLIAPKNLVFSETNFWLAGISSLILGGFLMALGLTIRGRKKESSSDKTPEDEGKTPAPPPPPASPSEQNPSVF
jgi:hypothetical protein